MRSADVFHSISELCADAEWTNEELDAALLAEGIDPNVLVNSVMSQVDPVLQHTTEDLVIGSIASQVGGSLPLIEVLRSSTRLSLSAISKALNVTSGFLTEIARHPKVIPESWRDELIARASRSLHIEANVIRQALMPDVAQRAVTLSQISRSPDTITYRGILDRSGMASREKQYWLNLASQQSSD
jgi:hypothetical protein